LVGKDTKLPDYVVLISTLGGIALFGLNGFVIGPLIAALFMAAWSLYAEAREEQEVVAVPAVPAEDVELPDESAEVAAAAVPAEALPAGGLPDSARPGEGARRGQVPRPRRTASSQP